MEPFSFAALAGVAFLAATVQAATGFGFAIMEVPFFLLIMGSLAAIQVTAVINFVTSLILIPRLIKGAPTRLITFLVIGSVIGFPIGLVVFKAASLVSVKIFAGGFLTAFAVFLLVREWRMRASGSRPERTNADRFMEKPAAEIGVGIVSGAMAVALAMPGPVVVLYLLARHAGKQISRAATLILFGFSYGTVSLVHTFWGGMTGGTWLLAAGGSVIALRRGGRGPWSLRHALSQRGTLSLGRSGDTDRIWTLCGLDRALMLPQGSIFPDRRPTPLVSQTMGLGKITH